MKFLAVILWVAFASVQSFASGKSAPRSDGYGSPQCRAYDSGKHEEHAPHLTCESCLSSGHSNCDMKCFSYDYTCSSKAKIITTRLIIDPVTKKPREELQESEMTYSATARTEGEARDRAMQQCLWANGYSNCMLNSCNENSHENSNQTCRR